MTKKGMVLCFAVLFALAGFCPSAIAEISGSASTEILTKYVGGSGTNIYDDLVSQTDFFLNLDEFSFFSKGYYFDIWISEGFKERRNPGEEYDLSFGKVTSLNEDETFQMDIGISYCKIYPSSDADIFSPYAVFSKKVGNFTPYVRFDVFLLTGDGTWENKVVRFRYGTSHHWKISPKISISQTGNMYHSFYKGDNSFGFHYKACLGYSIIPDKMSLNIFNDIYLPIHYDGRKNEIIPGIGINWNF